MAETAVKTLLEAMNHLSVVTDRKVVIDLCTDTNVYLKNPEVYLNSGYCEVPLMPTVKTGRQMICGFCKYLSEAKGAYGVLTYDMANDKNSQIDNRLAVMFSVPFDRNVFENYFALGIFNKDEPCDANLLNKMYYDEVKDGTTFTRAPANGGKSISVSNNGYSITGTMSQGAGAYMIVHVLSDKKVRDTDHCDTFMGTFFSCFKNNKEK